jgi:hypothetical protein
MDDKQITAGLSLLANEPPPDMDLDTVIATAKLRRQRRQAVTFTALGTATVVVALTAVLTSAGAGQNEPATGGIGPAGLKSPSAATSAAARPGSKDQARKLTQQLAEANVLPGTRSSTRVPPTRSQVNRSPRWSSCRHRTRTATTWRLPS